MLPPVGGATALPFTVQLVALRQYQVSHDDPGGTITVGLAPNVQLGAVTVIVAVCVLPHASVTVTV